MSFTHDQLHVLPSNHRPAAIWSLESTSTKSSTDLELKHLTVASLPPALPSNTAILESLTSIWQFWRLAEQYCPQEYDRRLSPFSQCQIKPAVFLTALWESQVLSTLPKWTEIAEDSRVAATKPQSSWEKRIVIPPYAQSLKWGCKNSYKQLTARLEFFLKGAVCCSASCALEATQLP